MSFKPPLELQFTLGDKIKLRRVRWDHPDLEEMQVAFLLPPFHKGGWGVKTRDAPGALHNAPYY